MFDYKICYPILLTLSVIYCEVYLIVCNVDVSVGLSPNLSGHLSVALSLYIKPQSMLYKT